MNLYTADFSIKSIFKFFIACRIDIEVNELDMQFTNFVITASFCNNVFQKFLIVG